MLAPLLLLWGANGGLGTHDVVRVWQEHNADPVRAAALGIAQVGRLNE